jgi:hypothetical protein
MALVQTVSLKMEQKAQSGQTSAVNDRGCYCDIWDKNPVHFESRGVPRGYCSFCQTCGRPGHTRHFPGVVAYTGCWCDFHYRMVSVIHPLGVPGVLIYFGIVAAGMVILWLGLGDEYVALWTLGLTSPSSSSPCRSYTYSPSACPSGCVYSDPYL